MTISHQNINSHSSEPCSFSTLTHPYPHPQKVFLVGPVSTVKWGGSFAFEYIHVGCVFVVGFLGLVGCEPYDGHLFIGYHKGAKLSRRYHQPRSVSLKVGWFLELREFCARHDRRLFLYSFLVLQCRPCFGLSPCVWQRARCGQTDCYTSTLSAVILSISLNLSHS